MNPPLTHVCMLAQESTLSTNKKHSDPCWSQKKYSKELRQKLVTMLGNRCVVCNKTENLQIDHIHGEGEKDRQQKGGSQASYRYYIKNPEEARKNLQVLCLNHNAIKAKNNYEQLKVKSMPINGPHIVGTKYYWANRETILEKKRIKRITKCPS